MAVNSLPIVVLISGSGTNLQAIIDAVQRDDLPVEIRAVISNRADAPGLKRAEQSNIPARVLNHRQYPDRRSFDLALQQLIDSYHPELIVMAGFMRILTPEFVAHYQGRMLNIHPSLLPLFRGLDTHRRALDAGHHTHGASVHFVTPELDGGPIVLQATVPVLPGDTPETLAARVQLQEHIIYPLAIDWFARGRLRNTPAGISLDGKPLHTPPTLTDGKLLFSDD